MKNWALIPYTLVGVVLLGGVTYVGLDIADVVPGILTTRDTPVLTAPPALPKDTKPIVAEEFKRLNPDAPIDESAIVNAVQAFGSSGGNMAAIVSDPYTGKVLAEYRPDALMIPASNMKIMTSVDGYQTLGSQYRLKTTTYLDGTSLYLRAGGDMLLGSGNSDSSTTIGHAGLETLASNTAKALTDKGVSSVTLYYDNSIWNGDEVNPNWTANDNYHCVGEVTPMAIDRGRVNPDELQFKHNVNHEAVSTFGSELSAKGIKVSYGDGAKTPIDKATKLAEVDSSPLGDIIHLMMKVSDNTLTEAVCHSAAVADGQTGDFAGSTAHLVAEIGSYGVNTDNFHPHDCSGLSYENRISVKTFNDLLNAVFRSDKTKAKSIYSDFPVANLDGTLEHRFGGVSDPGRITAKTGYLVQANSLSGFLVTKSGHLLIFSAIDNSSDSNTHIDKMVSTIANS